MLEYLPDAIIPFSGSRASQSTTIRIGPNAGFIGWEVVAAGRVARAELFRFESFRSECGIYSESRPLALERYSLNPAERDPASPARWGRFRYTATLYVCHTGVPQSRWLELESRLNQVAMANTSPSERWGVSALVAAGLVVRGLALEAHQITAGLQTFWTQAKQEIWGEPAVPPRKIN
jgi:urease accessory protein